MNSLFVKAALPNAFVFLMDYVSGYPPSSFANALVATTDTCVAVGALPDSEGETSIAVVLGAFEPAEKLSLRYEGVLHVKGPYLSLVNAMNQELGSIRFDSANANVQVWTDDPRVPSRIVFVVAPDDKYR